MNCNQIRELFPDLAAGLSAATPDITQHLEHCSACSDEFADLHQTMALLDEWHVPEPSPYFDTRLKARLREETARPVGWMQWFRKPVLAASFAILMVASAALIRISDTNKPKTMVTNVEPGSAVEDLQSLDKNHDLYSDFDVLDDLQVQQDVTANP